MPYVNGQTARVGDYVTHIETGKTGRVTHVNLNSAQVGGADQIHVSWDDGSVGSENSLADEFEQA